MVEGCKRGKKDKKTFKTKRETVERRARPGLAGQEERKAGEYIKIPPSYLV